VRRLRTTNMTGQSVTNFIFLQRTLFAVYSVGRQMEQMIYAVPGGFASAIVRFSVRWAGY
jgi:hypothetical protein